MSKILVTGASGFIGRALAARLKSEGWGVIALDSTDGDIADQETLSELDQENISHTFHLAGKTFVPDSWANPQAFCHTNVLGTVNVLELCKKNRIPLTYISAYVYGHPDSLPISEDSVIKPNSPYALSKRLAEEACEFYANAYDLSVTTIRPFNVYGIGQAEKFLIPEIIRQALDKGGEIVVKDLAPRRDYVYLEDLVAALLATLRKAGGYRVYNIGSGISRSVREIIDIIQKIAGTNKKVVSRQMVRTNELMDVSADISKAGVDLSWHPRCSFREGIEDIIRSEREKRRDD
ncbi:MAG: NAD(P)-dependent oxidoreductase [Nitrospira sp.]|nr:NAD(P)-dependent oxidoreductase [Nitrospira sp.]